MNKPLPEQLNVESKFSRARVDRILFRREQIKKQRRESCVVQRPRHKLIPRTMPATAAAMNEKNDGGGSIDSRQIAVERYAPSWNTDFVHFNFARRGPAIRALLHR